MPQDGNLPGTPQSDGRSQHENHASQGTATGLFAGYDPLTIVELTTPNRFPISADSGSYEDVTNSYIAGIAALQQVFSPAGVGKFVRPRENTWIRHELAVIAGGLEFNPKRYEFDRIVAHFANIPAAFDVHHRQYENYADLRMNLAVMRNYLLNHFFPDGDVENDPEDRRAAHSLNQIGLQIGDMLHRGNGWLPSLNASVSLARANEKGEGAALIYEKLRHGETVRNLLSPVLVPLNVLRNRSNMHWRLPPLQETPFDPRNLAAPLDTVSADDRVDTNGGGRPDAQAAQPDVERWGVVSQSFDDLGGSLAGVTAPLATVEDLSQPVKTRAIELAREILEKLRLKFAETPVEALLDQVDASEVYKLLKETQGLSDLFYAQAGRAALTDTKFYLDPDIQLAFDSLGKLSYQAKLQALKYSEESGNTENALRIARQIESMPATWRQSAQFNVGYLLGNVQTGLEKILQRLHEQTQSNAELRELTAPALGLSPASAQTIVNGNVLGQQSLPNNGAASGISPLQQRMQQVMASTQMANMAADRRTLAQESMAASLGGTPALAASSIMAAVPPPRPSRNPLSSLRRSPMGAPSQGLQSQAVQSAARRAAPAISAAVPSADPFGSLLNSRDLATMQKSVDASGIQAAPIGPRNARDTVSKIAASRGIDPLANQSQDPTNPQRPNGTGRM